MNAHDDWKLLRKFNSEVEARVVESFLTAQGFEVRLFDVHTNNMPSIRPLADGMRLMIRASQVEEAETALSAAQRPSHLEIVGEEQPVVRGKYELWMIWLVLLLAGIVFVLTQVEI